MKYIKTFNTDQEYQLYKLHTSYIEPNISYVIQDNKVNYNPLTTESDDPTISVILPVSINYCSEITIHIPGVSSKSDLDSVRIYQNQQADGTNADCFDLDILPSEQGTSLNEGGWILTHAVEVQNGNIIFGLGDDHAGGYLIKIEIVVNQEMYTFD